MRCYMRLYSLLILVTFKSWTMHLLSLKEQTYASLADAVIHNNCRFMQLVAAQKLSLQSCSVEQAHDLWKRCKTKQMAQILIAQQLPIFDEKRSINGVSASLAIKRSPDYIEYLLQQCPRAAFGTPSANPSRVLVRNKAHLGKDVLTKLFKLLVNYGAHPLVSGQRKQHNLSLAIKKYYEKRMALLQKAFFTSTGIDMPAEIMERILNRL